MKCPNCGTEFDGDICPNCNTQPNESEKTVTEVPTKDDTAVVQEETTPPEENVAIPNVEDTTDNKAKEPLPDEKSEESSYHFQEDLTPKKKPNGKIRLGLEIAGIVLLLISFISSAGKIPKEKYDALNDKYKRQTEKLDETNSAFENISAEYSNYKNKMSKFDDLSDDEIDTLIAEVDKIAADKKAADEKAAADKKATEEKAAAEAAAQAQAAASATTEQKNALKTAKSYLSYTAFSYTGLIKQLEFEGFPTEAATYGADNCGADWNAQAVAMAKNYMSYSSFSHQGLVDQLVFEGFTAEQAEYSASTAGY